MAKDAQKKDNIKELSQFSLEKILDVMIDIHHELEVTNDDTVIIPLLPPVVKFPSLMPTDGANFRDQYCHHRWQTLKFLANKKAIKQATLKEGAYGHRWTQNVEIKVNKSPFYQLFNKLQNKHKNFSKSKLDNVENLLDKLENDIKQAANKQIDYTDKVLRKACERKWDIIQRLWEKFEERGHPNQMLISIKYLTERVGDIEDIKGILENYQRQDCFKSLRKRTKNFQFNDINKDILEKAYKEIKETYEKFAKTCTDLSKGQKEKRIKVKKQDKTNFNPDDGILIFKNKKIGISKSKNTNPYFLLKALFKNKTKTWNYDEIYEEMFGEEYDKSKWKRIYNSAYDVNEKVAKSTTIKDFLQFTNTTVKIKNKYL
jgi:hypothetical protein